MKLFDDPLLQPLAYKAPVHRALAYQVLAYQVLTCRALELIEGDALGVTPTAT
ncbi:hypothetical protein [Streptomyces sp. NPDC005423]|uniref:hypothetical protein n=1 Tax=Streptomyces sp. NPDC005423 TaxID=3155343 RepID=UPI0033ABC61B